MLDKFLLYCAGVNQEILTKNASPAEKDKYTTIGFTVFCTAILAGLSGGYAIFTIFESVKIATGIGVFWGSFIFNIDRMFIISIKKDKNNGFKVLQVALPRIFIASLLGLLISKPIELKLFSKEIQETFEKEQKSTQRNDFNKIEAELITKNQALQGQLDKIKQQCEDEKYNMNQELNGKGGSNRKGAGSIFEQLKKQYDDCQKQLTQELNNTKVPDLIKTNNQQIEKFNQEKSLKIGSPSIFQQAVILDKLAQKDEFIFIIERFVIGLFITIEISPVLAKLLTPYGSYDAALKMIEESKKDYCEQKEAALKKIYEQRFKHQEEIVNTFWNESGGRFKYFIPQQVLKAFKILEDDKEKLNNFYLEFGDKLIEKMRSELINFISIMNINFNQNDAAQNQDTLNLNQNNDDDNKGASNPNQNNG